MHKLIALRLKFRTLGLIIALSCVGVLLFGATALADTAYFVKNSSESGLFVNALSDTVSGSTLEYSILNMTPGQISYFGSPNATSYSKVYPGGNGVAAGNWTLSAWGRSLNASKVVFSAEIGEYTSAGTYTVKIPYGDTPAGFGWTPDFKGANATMKSVTKVGAPAFTIAAGSRIYVRIYAKNTHSTQNRDAFLAYNSTATNSNLSTPPFAQPIPALGWYLVLAGIVVFAFFAVGQGVLKVRRDEA